MFAKRNTALAQYIKNVFGFRVNNIALYEQAFIHRTAVKSEEQERESNERLEYLGDAVLSAIIAEFLYKKYPVANEGFLTDMRSRLVSREQLNKLGRKIGLDKFIVKNESIHNLSASLYGNTFEALVGAIFIDKGYEKTRKALLNRILGNCIDLNVIEKEDNNYKGKILHYIQKYKLSVEYRTVKETKEETGRKEYLVYLFIDGKFVAEGCDYTIKSAQQHAAMAACEVLEL
ncbi:MAG: ribonuclease III [Bacteroidales bacterium]|nr:ribonuclease III [Bacteroidales bacterium]MBR4453111.1 ribonuclease III [Bacteroidales bacterium]MCR5555564.1 ribonuclease III [Bacteroidales bacterium]